MPTEREINIECYSDQRNSSMPDSRRTNKNYNESCGTTSSSCDNNGFSYNHLVHSYVDLGLLLYFHHCITQVMYCSKQWLHSNWFWASQ